MASVALHVHAPNPDSLYDQIISDATYEYCSKTNTPVRDSVIDTVVAEFEGQSGSVDVEAPDGTTHVVSGEGAIPDKETLIQQLNAATQALGSRPVSLLENLYCVRLGGLHFTDESVHIVVGDEAYDGTGQRGTGDLPDDFSQLGVKVAHTCEGFVIGESKDYHWRDELSWTKIQSDVMDQVYGNEAGRDSDRDGDFDDRPGFKSHPSGVGAVPAVSNCWVINLPSVFPAQSFGQATNPPVSSLLWAIEKTERLVEETLLTKRQAQYRAIKTGKYLIDDPNHDYNQSVDAPFEEIVMQTFDLSESGFRSLQSNIKDRRRKAFQTVRELSDSDDFTYVMEEFAETIDELGQLAILGAEYRREQGKPPGFY